jgi:pimeloyl-ACP methyl ester carboxylesterase
MLRDDEELLLLIHGSGEGPSAWPARVQTALAGRGSWDSRRIVRIDWASAAADRIVAPRRGEQIGAELARYLLRSFSAPGAITVVSHSAGAFLAHGFACELRRQEGDPVRGRAAGRGRDWTEPVLTQLFLDPFLARSPLRWRYGIRRFGTCADRAFAWVNTGDPVPFTSGFPRHAGREDLRTLAAGLTDSEAPGHWIPVAAFVRVTDDLEPGSTLGEVIGASTDQAMEEFPWAMFAKGPACTKAGCPSIVCGRFGCSGFGRTVVTRLDDGSPLPRSRSIARSRTRDGAWSRPTIFSSLVGAWQFHAGSAR